MLCGVLPKFGGGLLALANRFGFTFCERKSDCRGFIFMLVLVFSCGFIGTRPAGPPKLGRTAGAGFFAEAGTGRFERWVSAIG